MAERTWQEVGANRAEVTSALEAVAANNAQLVAQENVASEQRDRALRQTVREEFDGYRAHLAIALQLLTLFWRIWQPSCGMSRLWCLNFETRVC